MPARFSNMLARTALLTLTALLSACATDENPEKGSNTSKAGTSLQDSMWVLLDPARQLYRFKSGVCRELGKVPSPWRQYSSKRYEKRGTLGQRFPPGYDWGPRSYLIATEVTLEAEYAQLGVPPANTLPGRIRRSGLSQDVALLSLGSSLAESPHWMHLAILDALSGAYPDWHAQQSIPYKTRWGAARIFVPAEAPFPVSDRFGAYADGPKERVRAESPLVIINPAQRAGVYCDSDYDLPNPSCRGVILLGDDEVATIQVNYESLGKLHEVVESMIRAAHAIRVNCPLDGVTA